MKKIYIKGLRYPVVITRDWIKCHDRKETIEVWRKMMADDIASPNAQRWWAAYKKVILEFAAKIDEEDEVLGVKYCFLNKMKVWTCNETKLFFKDNWIKFKGWKYRGYKRLGPQSLRGCDANAIHGIKNHNGKVPPAEFTVRPFGEEPLTIKTKIHDLRKTTKKINERK